MSKKIIKSICRMDHGGCGVLIYVEDGKAVRVEGNPEHPISRGRLCIKGRAAIDLLYHPDRLKYPLKRKGGRGEGKWQRISWDEALGTVADEMNKAKRQHSAESVAMASGTNRNNHTLLYRLANVFSTPNFISHANTCFIPRMIITSVTAGGPTWFPRFYYPFDVVPKCLVTWGIVSSTCNNDSPHPCGFRFMDVVDKVENLIVIDPRRSREASRAHIWLQIRPGTDGALALGMLMS